MRWLHANGVGRAMISIRQIQAFKAVVDTGNFTAAANLLGTSQPAISKRIAEMEAALGVSLFDRDGRHPQLTRHGHAVMPLCADILRLCDRLRASVDDISAYSGTFRLGVAELVALTFLPALVGLLKARLPNMQLHVEVKMAEDLFDDVLHERLDAAISPGSPSPSLHRRRVARMDMAWMCAGNREDVPDRMTVDMLATLPLLAQTQRSGLQAMVNAWLAKNGVRPGRVLTCNSLSALYGMTVAGLGLSLLPRSYFQLRLDERALKIVDIDPAIDPLEYHVVHIDTGLQPIVDIVADEIVAAASASAEWS